MMHLGNGDMENELLRQTMWTQLRETKNLYYVLQSKAGLKQQQK